MNKFHKARNLVNMSMVAPDARDKEGRIRTANVSGSKAKSYHVILRRHNSRITAECRLSTGVGFLPCPSNEYLCWHSLAVIMTAIEETGKKVSFCHEKDKAENLSNLGGQIFAASKWKSDKVNWLVVK